MIGETRLEYLTLCRHKELEDHPISLPHYSYAHCAGGSRRVLPADHRLEIPFGHGVVIVTVQQVLDALQGPFAKLGPNEIEEEQPNAS